jgi:hypothetical protein
MVSNTNTRKLIGGAYHKLVTDAEVVNYDSRPGMYAPCSSIDQGPFR